MIPFPVATLRGGASEARFLGGGAYSAPNGAVTLPASAFPADLQAGDLVIFGGGAGGSGGGGPPVVQTPDGQPAAGWTSWTAATSFYNTAITWKVLTAAEAAGLKGGTWRLAVNGNVLAWAVLVYRNAGGVRVRRSGTTMNADTVALAGLTKRQETVGLVALTVHITGYPTLNVPASFALRGRALTGGGSSGALAVGDLVGSSELDKYANGSPFVFSGHGASGYNAAAILEIVAPLSAGTVEAAQSEPYLTSNSAPAGHSASVGTAEHSSTAFRAFDGDPNNYIRSSYIEEEGTYTFFRLANLVRGFPTPITLGAIGLKATAAYPAYMPRSVTLEVFDGQEWIPLHTWGGLNTWAASELKRLDLPRSAWWPSASYRFNFGSSAWGDDLIIGDIYLYKGSVQ